MANSSKRKGDRAELEVQGLLRDLLGVPARRALGAGRKDDVGDIHGVPDTVIQVANWKDVAMAVRVKALEAECQRREAAALYASAFLRIRKTSHPTPYTSFPNWRVLQTVEQWAAMWREAQ